jgi:hypothetical protein
MTSTLAIVINMTQPSIAIAVYIAISAVIIFLLWFLLNPRESILKKIAVLCMLAGIWFYSDSDARQWHTVIMPNGKSIFADLPVHGYTYRITTALLGAILVLSSIILAVLDWRWKRNKIHPGDTPNTCSRAPQGFGGR